MRRLAVFAGLAMIATPALSAGFDLPPRKPGQWEMSIIVDSAAMPPQIIRMCLDKETDQLLNQQFGGMAANMCSKQEQKKDGDAIVLDSECKLGDMVSSSHTVVTGDFNTGYTMKTDIKMSGSNAPRSLQSAGPEGPAAMAQTITAKRVGECEAGFKPGDIDLGGDRRINVREMPKPQIQ